VSQNYPDIDHCFDVWHVVFFLSISTISFVKCFSFYHTGVKKKLLKVAKYKDCEEWIKSITHHMYWCVEKENGYLVEITKGTLM